MRIFYTLIVLAFLGFSGVVASDYFKTKNKFGDAYLHQFSSGPDDNIIQFYLKQNSFKFREDDNQWVSSEWRIDGGNKIINNKYWMFVGDCSTSRRGVILFKNIDLPETGDLVKDFFDNVQKRTYDLDRIKKAYGFIAGYMCEASKRNIEK